MAGGRASQSQVTETVSPIGEGGGGCLNRNFGQTQVKRSSLRPVRWVKDSLRPVLYRTASKLVKIIQTEMIQIIHSRTPPGFLCQAKGHPGLEVLNLVLPSVTRQARVRDQAQVL